ncbi:hypothetical protein Barb7_01151 [Bacteroidales bacterium Barb7]|nr:hypothetical protein Barb7_01151 [Bacteroidales bacterium Barb7]
MQRSEMWGYGMTPLRKSCKDDRILYVAFCICIVLITPHSASLHVGLKSLAPSGHLRNVLPLVTLRKRKCCTFAARKTDNLTGKR